MNDSVCCYNYSIQLRLLYYKFWTIDEKRNSQGLWVSKEELEQEEKQSGKKTNKSFLGVSF